MIRESWGLVSAYSRPLGLQGAYSSVEGDRDAAVALPIGDVKLECSHI